MTQKSRLFILIDCVVFVRSDNVEMNVNQGLLPNMEISVTKIGSERVSSRDCAVGTNYRTPMSSKVSVKSNKSSSSAICILSSKSQQTVH
jgi:hypothetical protein